MRVILIDRKTPDESGNLTIGRAYEVLGLEGDWFRLLNDHDEPVLYDPACFRISDSEEPAGWVSVVDDGCRYAYPPEWGHPGFFEDWHDGNLIVREKFMHQLRERSLRIENSE